MVEQVNVREHLNEKWTVAAYLISERSREDSVARASALHKQYDWFSFKLTSYFSLLLANSNLPQISDQFKTSLA